MTDTQPTTKVNGTEKPVEALAKVEKKGKSMPRNVVYSDGAITVAKRIRGVS